MANGILDQCTITRGLGARLAVEDLPELASLAQTAEVMGLSVQQVRGLISSKRLEHVVIGQRPFIPRAAIPRFIAHNTVQPCPQETPAPVSVSLKNGSVFTSVGPRMGAAESAARALQIAKELKASSPNSYESAPEPGGRVIRLKS